jgi:hypothetical protein
MSLKNSTRLLAALLVLSAARMAAGCGDGGISPPASPVVSPDSEEGKKAQAEDEALRKLRREQEAKAAARKRGLNLPKEG